MEVANNLFGVLRADRCLACGAGTPRVLCAPCVRRMRAASPVPSIPWAARVLAPLDYAGPARDLLLALKAGGRRDAVTPLASACVGAARAAPVTSDLICWVPARRRDISERGYDHAAVLAGAIARGLGLPVCGLLRRTSSASDQVGLTRTERKKNVKGLFSARPCSGATLLVDDLITTGATASACAGALREAGASRVEVLAACFASDVA